MTPVTRPCCPVGISVPAFREVGPATCSSAVASASRPCAPDSASSSPTRHSDRSCLRNPLSRRRPRPRGSPASSPSGAFPIRLPPRRRDVEAKVPSGMELSVTAVTRSQRRGHCVGVRCTKLEGRLSGGCASALGGQLCDDGRGRAGDFFVGSRLFFRLLPFPRAFSAWDRAPPSAAPEGRALSQSSSSQRITFLQPFGRLRRSSFRGLEPVRVLEPGRSPRIATATSQRNAAIRVGGVEAARRACCG